MNHAKLYIEDWTLWNIASDNFNCRCLVNTQKRWRYLGTALFIDLDDWHICALIAHRLYSPPIKCVDSMHYRGDASIDPVLFILYIQWLSGSWKIPNRATINYHRTIVHHIHIYHGLHCQALQRLATLFAGESDTKLSLIYRYMMRCLRSLMCLNNKMQYKQFIYAHHRAIYSKKAALIF